MAAITTRSGPSAPARQQAPTTTRPHGRALITIVSVMILIGAEVFGVALSAAWAVAGVYELGDIVGYVLMAAFSVFGLYLMVLLWRRAIAVELGRGH